MNDLPAALRSEVVQHTHGEIIQKINFFRDKDPDFLWAILPALRPLKLLPSDVLYTQGDHSDESITYYSLLILLCSILHQRRQNQIVH